MISRYGITSAYTLHVRRKLPHARVTRTCETGGRTRWKTKDRIDGHCDRRYKKRCGVEVTPRTLPRAITRQAERAERGAMNLWFNMRPAALVVCTPPKRRELWGARWLLLLLLLLLQHRQLAHLSRAHNFFRLSANQKAIYSAGSHRSRESKTVNIRPGARPGRTSGVPERAWSNKY